MEILDAICLGAGGPRRASEVSKYLLRVHLDHDSDFPFRSAVFTRRTSIHLPDPYLPDPCRVLPLRSLYFCFSPHAARLYPHPLCHQCHRNRRLLPHPVFPTCHITRDLSLQSLPTRSARLSAPATRAVAGRQSAMDPARLITFVQNAYRIAKRVPMCPYTLCCSFILADFFSAMATGLQDLRRRESTCPTCLYRIDVPLQLYHQLGGQVGKDGGTFKARECFFRLLLGLSSIAFSTALKSHVGRQGNSPNQC